jgi:hypothetical protein
LLWPSLFLCWRCSSGTPSAPIRRVSRRERHLADNPIFALSRIAQLDQQTALPDQCFANAVSATTTRTGPTKAAEVDRKSSFEFSERRYSRYGKSCFGGGAHCIEQAARAITGRLIPQLPARRRFHRTLLIWAGPSPWGERRSLIARCAWPGLCGIGKSARQRYAKT